MSRKTEPRHRAHSGRIPSPKLVNPLDLPRITEPVPLVCGVCGAIDQYSVGTVVLNPVVYGDVARDDIDEAVGFTGYFRCRTCDAGGPWKLPQDTSLLISVLALAALAGKEDVPLTFASNATFDKHAFRYMTEGEAHLKALIDKEPDRAFLWVRLGNLYVRCELEELAESAFERAIELDPKDVEAHGMLAQLLIDHARRLQAVPHLQAVLKHVRDAHQVDVGLRRQLVRHSIESLLNIQMETKGVIDVFPRIPRNDVPQEWKDEPAIIELRQFDLSDEDDLDELCDLFLEQRLRPARGPVRRRKNPVPRTTTRLHQPTIQQERSTPSRNEPCPCGSGLKYKKCCGGRT